LIWQSRFTSALQLPSQLASHLAVQSADAGVTSHEAPHSPEQVALQLPSHIVLSLDDEHLPLQSASQLTPQFASQSKLPGSISQDAEQPPVHDTVQSTSALNLQLLALQSA
jgi:hypothetical protein